jgi:hypothetical protein
MEVFEKENLNGTLKVGGNFSEKKKLSGIEGCEILLKKWTGESVKIL